MDMFCPEFWPIWFPEGFPHMDGAFGLERETETKEFRKWFAHMLTRDELEYPWLERELAHDLGELLDGWYAACHSLSEGPDPAELSADGVQALHALLADDEWRRKLNLTETDFRARREAIAHFTEEFLATCPCSLAIRQTYVAMLDSWAGRVEGVAVGGASASDASS